MSFWSRKRRDDTGAGLVIRPGSRVKRDVYKAATAGVTGVTAFGALTVTGAVAGAAAHDTTSDPEFQAGPPAAPTAEVVTQRRKHRTVVRMRVVQEVSSSGVASTGSGGTVRPRSTGSGSGGSSASSGAGSASAPTHSAPQPAAPKPPAPAPSSGS